jgi:hypothetical protein
MTPAALNQAIREAFAYAARYIGLLTENNPHGGSAGLLGRPDVHAVLQDAMASAREVAEEAVREAWGGHPQTPYLYWLLNDVAQAYGSLSVLRADIRRAWDGVVAEPFVKGVTPPGANPVMEAAQRRASDVLHAILGYGASLALRSQLSAEVASVAAQTEAVLAQGAELEQAGEQPYKRWLCSSSPPDDRTCHWCRALHWMTIPLNASFPAGDPADLTGHGRLTHPPRLYHGVLPGPPRHPRCRCRVVVVHLREAVRSGHSDSQEASPGELAAAPGAGGTAPSMVTPGFLAASDVRALPDDQYEALEAFLEASAHELGQALARLREVA